MPAPDRRLPWFVVLYGALVGADAVFGASARGSDAAFVVGLCLSILLAAAGVGMLLRWAFAARAAQWVVLLTIAVMGERLVSSGGIVPAVPVIATGLALSYVLWLDRPGPAASSKRPEDPHA